MDGARERERKKNAAPFYYHSSRATESSNNQTGSKREKERKGEKKKAGNQQTRNNKAKSPKKRGKPSSRGNTGMTSETMAPVKRTGTFRRRKFADLPPVLSQIPLPFVHRIPRVRCNLRFPRLDKWHSCGTGVLMFYEHAVVVFLDVVWRSPFSVTFNLCLR